MEAQLPLVGPTRRTLELNPAPENSSLTSAGFSLTPLTSSVPTAQMPRAIIGVPPVKHSPLPLPFLQFKISPPATSAAPAPPLGAILLRPEVRRPPSLFTTATTTLAQERGILNWTSAYNLDQRRAASQDSVPEPPITFGRQRPIRQERLGQQPHPALPPPRSINQ